MKLRLLILFISAFAFFAQAQVKKNIYYLTEAGKEVATRQEADFIRVIEEPDSGDNRFKLLEFFQNGKRKSQGYVNAFEPRLVYQGAVLSFDSLGNRTQMMNYENGVLAGISIFYHPNGKEKRRAEYIQMNPGTDQMIGISSSLNQFVLNTNSRIIYDADSTGHVNISDGNGHLKETTKSGDDELFQEGDYINGFKHGVWSGRYAKKGDTFIEKFESGKLISGETIIETVNYPYTAAMEAPEFPGGQTAWNKYLGSATRYPSDAQKNGVRGAVMLSFVVNKKGDLVEIKIDKSVYPSIDEEARRVLSSSPRWKPGKQRGVPVRVKYNQRMNFNF